MAACVSVFLCLSICSLVYITPSQAFLYGDTYDMSVKAMVKASQTFIQMTKQAGMKECLTDISNLALSEKADDKADADVHEGDAVDQLPGNEELLIPDDVIEVTLKPKDHKSKTAHDMPETKTIRISKLSDTRRDAVLRGKKMVSGLLSLPNPFACAGGFGAHGIRCHIGS